MQLDCDDSTTIERAARDLVTAVVAATSDEDMPRPDPGDAALAGQTDHKNYRSFYVGDAAFLRFRAAIYWLSRHPDACDEVPENMSVAAEKWMLEMATSMEKRWNGGDSFRAPPVAKRRKP